MLFDASGGNQSASATALSWSHTCTGQNLVLLVGIFVNSGDNISAVTYNSVPMTQLTKQATGDGTEIYIYGLINPSTGANNVVFTISGGATAIAGVSASYTGAKQSGLPDAVGAGANTASATLAVSVTTNVANVWVIGIMNHRAAQAITSVTNGVQRGAEQASILSLWDSDMSVSPAGSFTMTMNLNGSSAQNSMVLASVISLPGAGGAFLYNFI